MKLIIGLGNVGTRYEGTRHNIGFESVNAFGSEYDATWKEQKRRKAYVASVTVRGETVILAKPTTYMNRSGEAVQALLSYYKVEPEDLLIVHDDMDLEPGRIQFKDGGSAAGHNGIEDIHRVLGTQDIQRLRIGIGHPPNNTEPADWVLTNLSPKEAPNALDIISGMRDWIEYGMQTASNTWN